MTVYAFTRVLVWDQLGGSVKVARNQRVDVTDPATGLTAPDLISGGVPVGWLTTDSSGHVDFTSTLGTVRLTPPTGLWTDVTSPDAIAAAITAGLASDASIAGYVNAPASATRTALNSTYGSRSGSRPAGQDEIVVSVLDHGAVADWNGTTGTDNAAAFAAAKAVTPEGGTLLVPPGRYYHASTFVMDKAIHLSAGAGGFTGGPVGTQLVFAAGVSGIQVVNTGSVAPAKWRIGPFNIKSLSTAPGADVGIFISAGRGSVEGATVESFGSHGVHIKAGVGFGGNNANNTELHAVRSYTNWGDGIIVEGTDANACLIVKPDVVSNYGWGINLERSSATKVTAPHADQRANGSPGAFRDNGTANDWDWVYVEGAGTFLIDTNSSHGRFVGSGYAPATVVSNTSNSVTWRIEQDSGARNVTHYRELGSGKKLWRMIPGSLAAGSFDLIQQTDGLRVFSVDSGVTRVQWYADQRPATDASKSLGSSSLRWLNGFFSGFVRVGATTTALRPTAATAGPGGHMFDTTLNKPIWSDGANWRDATGTVV